MSTKQQEHEYIVQCRITRRTEVIIIAVSEEEARSKFDAAEWQSEYARDLGEIVDFRIDGKIKLND